MPPRAPESPAASTAAEPRTLEEAEALLEQARAELSSVALSVQPAPATAGAAPPYPVPPAADAAPAPRVEAAQEAEVATKSETRDEARPEERASSPCETACKAFGSLLRAKDAVCRLEAPRGPRCERAEGIARDAEARVQGCTCAR